MNFQGFEEADFELFSIPDFAGRMGEIRARVRPKLLALGEDLTSQIESAVGVPTFPHVAQHMRRRVNPPEETWVAFTRDKRGYKRWTHFRVAISGAGIRVVVFVENDADDKPAFGQGLSKKAGSLLKSLDGEPAVRWYTVEEDGGSANITKKALTETGERLQRLKTPKFQAGIPLPRPEAAGMAPDRFEEWALEQVERLKPLYLLGVGR